METPGSEHKGLSKHAIIMALCCLIPLALLAVMWAIGVSENYLVFGVILLCPILHIVLMRGMFKGGGNDH